MNYIWTILSWFEQLTIFWCLCCIFLCMYRIWIKWDAVMLNIHTTLHRYARRWDHSKKRAQPQLNCGMIGRRERKKKGPTSLWKCNAKMFHFNDCNDLFLLIFLYSIIIMAQSLTTVSFIYSMHQSLSTTYISRQTKTGRLHHLQFLIKQLRDRILWDESWIRCMLLKLNNKTPYKIKLQLFLVWLKFLMSCHCCAQKSHHPPLFPVCWNLC